jgi:hypothetical protein
MRRASWILLVVGLLSFLLVTRTITYADTVVVNGDFSSTPGTGSDPFAAWSTTYGNLPTDGGGFALFSEGISSQTELEQAFYLPANAWRLSFEFRLVSSDDPLEQTGTPPDSFQATLLYDSALQPFPDPVDPGFAAFYSMDNTGQEFLQNGLVSVESLANSWKRVTLDVRTLAPRDVLLEFVLNGNIDGLATAASLDNVRVYEAAAVPLPSVVWGGSALLGLAAVSRAIRHRCPVWSKYSAEA